MGRTDMMKRRSQLPVRGKTPKRMKRSQLDEAKVQAEASQGAVVGAVGEVVEQPRVSTSVPPVVEDRTNANGEQKMAMSTKTKLGRLSYLTQNGGTKVCKKLFQKRVAELIPDNEDPKLWTTDAFLKMYRNKIECSNLNKRSQKILFPVEGSHTQLEHWDLYLLIYILETACKIEGELKEKLLHLKKLRNKLAHFGDSEMSDAQYAHYFEKVTVIFESLLKELNDKDFETTIRCMITKSEKDEICDTELAMAFQELCRSIKESEEKTEQIITQEHRETRQQIEIGNRKMMDMITRVENKLSQIDGKDSSDKMTVPVKIKPVNCDTETDELISRELVDIFIEAITKNVDHAEFPEDDQEKRRIIFEVFRVLKGKGYPIVHAERGCVLLHFQFSSVVSLLSFYKDYINGNFETYLDEIKQAVQIGGRFQDFYFEMALYKDDLYEILQNIGGIIEKKTGVSIFVTETNNDEEQKHVPGSMDSQSAGGSPSVLLTVKPSSDFDERDFENTLQWASEQLTHLYKSPLQASIVKNEDKGSEQMNVIPEQLDIIGQKLPPDTDVNAGMARPDSRGKHGLCQSLRGEKDTKYLRRVMDEGHFDEYRSSHYGSFYSQMRHQLQRPNEASKQMMYGVFRNVISILEELERRETGRQLSLPRSKIHIPDQINKSTDDLESIVNTQLLLFETQTKACPPEVLAELKDELKRRIVAWAAVQEEVGVKGVKKTDMYVTKLYEILAKGSAQHDFPSRLSACVSYPRVSEMAFNPYQTSYQSAYTPGPGRSSHHARERESYDHRDQRYGYSQSQMQNQLQRPKEASKQMLYGAFGNVVGILEEFEERENAMLQGRPLPKSNIHIPDQRHKSNQDIESIVSTQLLLFETQTKACPPEVLQELKDELKRRTIAWAAVREEMGIKGVHKTDMYVAKMYEILAKGRTQHTIPDRSGVTEEVMRDSFQKVLHGDHERRMVDDSFRRDPSRRAAAPDTRTSELYHEGAQRITRARGNNDLDADLHQSVRKYQTSNR